MCKAGEPPTEAARRLVHEQLGIRIPIRSMLLVQWIQPRAGAPAVTAYTFLGAELTQRMIGDIRADPATVEALRMEDRSRASDLLPEDIAGQLPFHGKPPPSTRYAETTGLPRPPIR